MYKKILSATLALSIAAFLILSLGSNFAVAKGGDDGGGSSSSGSGSGGGGSSSGGSSGGGNSSASKTRDSGMDSARDVAERGAGSVSETRDSGMDSARDVAERGAGSVSETRDSGMDSARDILERGTGVRLLESSGSSNSGPGSSSSNSGPGSVNSGRDSDRITTRGGAIEIRDAIIKSISSDGAIKAVIGDRTFDIDAQSARLKQRDIAGDVPFSTFKVGDPIRVRGTVSANGNVISATRVIDRRLPVGVQIVQRVEGINDIQARLGILLDRVRVLQVNLGRREDRRADRQADRQLNRQEDRQLNRQEDRQLNRQEDRQLDRRNP